MSKSDNKDFEEYLQRYADTYCDGDAEKARKHATVSGFHAKLNCLKKRSVSNKRSESDNMIKKLVKLYLLRLGEKECKKNSICWNCKYNDGFFCAISRMISKL